MADNPRIEELRRRVQKDPASIAFAQLAEEYRRAGRYEESIETCEVGLGRHPGYLSARVTLGRALIEVGQLERAHGELSQVLKAAPENLAALRGLAEIHHRQGDLSKALEYYRSALEFARHDPDLEQVVAEISRELEPGRPAPEVTGGLSFEEVRNGVFSESSVDAIRPAASVAPMPPAPPPSAPETLIRRPEPEAAAPGPQAEEPGPRPSSTERPADQSETLLIASAELPAQLPEAQASVEPIGEDEETLVPIRPSEDGTAEELTAVDPAASRDIQVAREQFAELERWLEALAPERPAENRPE